MWREPQMKFLNYDMRYKHQYLIYFRKDKCTGWKRKETVNRVIEMIKQNEIEILKLRGKILTIRYLWDEITADWKM